MEEEPDTDLGDNHPDATNQRKKQRRRSGLSRNSARGHNQKNVSKNSVIVKPSERAQCPLNNKIKGTTKRKGVMPHNKQLTKQLRNMKDKNARAKQKLLLQKQEEETKVSCAVAAVEEKASQELQIEREIVRNMFDRIKTTTDQQKQKSIDQMRGMRQRQHLHNEIFKQKLSKVMKRNLEVMEKNEHDIESVWKQRMASLQHHHENEMKELMQRLSQQQKKHSSEMKEPMQRLSQQKKSCF